MMQQRESSSNKMFSETLITGILSEEVRQSMPRVLKLWLQVKEQPDSMNHLCRDELEEVGGGQGRRSFWKVQTSAFLSQWPLVLLFIMVTKANAFSSRLKVG